MEIVERTVGVVVREKNDPAAIRRAFKLGCAGVIVDNDLSQDVSAEVQRLSSAPLSEQNNIKLKQLLLCPLQDRRSWRWSDSQEPLAHTYGWLMDELEWAVSAGLRPSFARETYEAGPSLVLWTGGGITTRWHQDIPKPDVKDVHVHIGGDSIKIAAPAAPLHLKFLFENNAANLVSDAQATMNKITLDQQLEERGVTLLELEPGQRLIFNSDCLHRSALPRPEAPVKLRAGIF